MSVVQRVVSRLASLWQSGFVYNDPSVWVDPKTIAKTNEKAKLLKEKCAGTL